MAGGKVPVHFKVVASEEYEAVDEKRPHALSVKGGCTGAAAGVFY